MNTIHFSNNKFINDNQYVNTFIIINNSFTSKIDLTNGFSMAFEEIDDYDVIFIADEIIENNNIVYLTGTIGYYFDPVYIELLYDLSNNKIYIMTDYRLLSSEIDFVLYKNTYQISYDKYWTFDKTKNTSNEEIITDKYQEINNISIPYYRFPRSKDGISIPRVLHNVFKVFSSEEQKPDIIIPINRNIYRKLDKNN
jgi:hypothetical protein